MRRSAARHAPWRPCHRDAKLSAGWRDVPDDRNAFSRSPMILNGVLPQKKDVLRSHCRRRPACVPQIPALSTPLCSVSRCTLTSELKGDLNAGE